MTSYIGTLDKELQRAEKEQARIDAERNAERQEAQAIQKAMAAADSVISRMFPMMTKEYGDDNKAKVISDYLIHTAKVRTPEAMEQNLKQLMHRGPRKAKGIDKVYAAVEGWK